MVDIFEKKTSCIKSRHQTTEKKLLGEIKEYVQRYKSYHQYPER